MKTLMCSADAIRGEKPSRATRGGGGGGLGKSGFVPRPFSCRRKKRENEHVRPKRSEKSKVGGTRARSRGKGT